MHSSAVVNDAGEAILLVGGSYGGKSTLLLYLITKGYSFFSDDLVLVDRENIRLKYFPRHLHIREKTLDMFSDFFRARGIQTYKLSNDSYFVKLQNSEKNTIIPKIIIEVEYNSTKNLFVEKTGFDKVLNITKNMKGTNISNWQNNVVIFSKVRYYDLKYTDFDFIDKVILKKIGGIL